MVLFSKEKAKSVIFDKLNILPLIGYEAIFTKLSQSSTSILI